MHLPLSKPVLEINRSCATHKAYTQRCLQAGFTHHSRFQRISVELRNT